jgi:hypothetical protein
MNNDAYNETITRNGKIYHYDPDTDIYYCRSAAMSTWDKWSPIVAIVVLGAAAFWVEYLR